MSLKNEPVSVEIESWNEPVARPCRGKPVHEVCELPGRTLRVAQVVLLVQRERVLGLGLGLDGLGIDI